MAQTLKELAYQYIRGKISDGSLAPGDRVSDFSLSKEIGISRTPVREAINQLLADNLVEAIAHAGTFVKRPVPEELEEYYELREALEGFAAEKATRTCSDKDIKKLRDICVEICRITQKARAEKLDGIDEEGTLRFHNLDMDFHTSIIKLAGNARLQKVVEDFRVLNRPFAALKPVMKMEGLMSATRSHVRIMRAIRRREAEKARKAMAAHISLGKKEMIKKAKQWEEDGGRHSELPEKLREIAGRKNT